MCLGGGCGASGRRVPACAPDALPFSLLTLAVGEALGHIAFSPAVVGAAHRGWQLLDPVGVFPHCQGRGIGSALVRESLWRQREQGAAGFMLVGDSGFSARFGFRNTEGLVYRGVPDRYVLARWFGDVAPQGELLAHAVFAVPDA